MQGQSQLHRGTKEEGKERRLWPYLKAAKQQFFNVVVATLTIVMAVKMMEGKVSCRPGRPWLISCMYVPNPTACPDASKYVWSMETLHLHSMPDTCGKPTNLWPVCCLGIFAVGDGVSSRTYIGKLIFIFFTHPRTPGQSLDHFTAHSSEGDKIPALNIHTAVLPFCCPLRYPSSVSFRGSRCYRYHLLQAEPSLCTRNSTWYVVYAVWTLCYVPRLAGNYITEGGGRTRGRKKEASFVPHVIHNLGTSSVHV